MAYLVSVGFYVVVLGLAALVLPRRLVGGQGRRIAALAVLGGVLLMGYGGASLAARPSAGVPVAALPVGTSQAGR